MASRHLSVATLALLVLGAILSAAWIMWGGGEATRAALAQARALPLLAATAVTALTIGIRFVRWQYLLRRGGVRVPVRPSLGYFVASLAGRATPAYVGELVRAVFLRRHHGVSLRASVVLMTVERLLDIAALAVIAAVTAAIAWAGWLAAGGAAGALLVAVLVWRLLPPRPGAPLAPRPLVPPGFWVSCALSLVAWLPAAWFLLPLAARSISETVPGFEGSWIFSASTLVGGATLMPVGVGATGAFMILRLAATGIAEADAVVITALLRLVTIGFSCVVGAAWLVVEIRRLRSAGAPARKHFDAIADDYAAQFSPEVWKLLLERKVGLMRDVLPSPPAQAGLGLDIGAGLGHQAAAMEAAGYRMVAVEPAAEIARHARARGVRATTGSALKLPFADGAFDFAYAVGVLHHVGDPRAQAEACREIGRVLRPGGMFLVHETNTLNPLFRFYMGYVFPLLKSIDEGTEWWIPPDRWRTVEGFEVVTLRHFTFLPDMIPKPLMPLFLRIERALEQSALRKYSVHYMVALRRVSRADVPSAPGGSRT